MQSAKDKVYTEVRNKHAKECEYAELMKMSMLLSQNKSFTIKDFMEKLKE